MSDSTPTIERWEAPFFEKPTAVVKKMDPAEVEALAQSRGFQAGKWEGLESGRAEAEKIVHRMTELLDEMAKPYRSLDHVVTQELANLAMLIARQVIRRELMINSDVVTDMAKEALSTISSLEGEIEISLHPSDMEMVHQLAKGRLDGKSWKLVVDPDFLPGGCRIKTPVSYVDGSMEKQMEMVFSRLIDSCENSLEG
ncbi:MAG: FliH/SctL family protein [Porticoccus sp.]|nr:FliH/SctL family protein [Porticoccus sp.]